MGREQELIQAVKNGDVPGVQKLVAKIKASKSSEYLGREPWAPSPWLGTPASPGVQVLAPTPGTRVMLRLEAGVQAQPVRMNDWAVSNPTAELGFPLGSGPGALECGPLSRDG